MPKGRNGSRSYAHQDPEPDLPDPVWERHPKESAPAWEAFSTWRDLPVTERTYTRACEILGKSRSLLSLWAIRFRWQERGRAWDRERERAYANGQLLEIQRMGERHAARAAAAIDALMVPLVVVARRISDPRSMQELEQAPMPELLKLAAQTVRPLAGLIAAERLARGEPTAIERVDVEVGAGSPAPKLAEVIDVVESLGLLTPPVDEDGEGSPPLSLAR
jgi:hypothetical protein